MINVIHIVCSKIWQTGDWPTQWTSHWSSHYQRKEICKCDKSITQSASLAIPARSCWRPYWTCRGTGRFPYGKKYYRANLQYESTDGKISTTSTRFTPCLYRLQKAFDRVWHTTLWTTMYKCNIGAKPIIIIKNVCDKSKSAVHFKGSTGDWFRTTVGVRQGCLLSPTQFNILLEKIMTVAPENQSALLAEKSQTYILKTT